MARARKSYFTDPRMQVGSLSRGVCAQIEKNGRTERTGREGRTNRRLTKQEYLPGPTVPRQHHVLSMLCYVARYRDKVVLLLVS